MFSDFSHTSQFRSFTSNQIQEAKSFEILEFLVGKFDDLDIPLLKSGLTKGCP